MDGSLLKALQALEDADGHIEPEAVIVAARDENSPLFAHFEWEDATAAHQHRLRQARQLIAQMRIVETVREVPTEIPKYVRDVQLGGYRDIVRVRGDEDAARDTITAEMGRVIQAAKRAQRIAAYLGTIADVVAIREMAEGVIRRVTVNDQPAGEA